MGKSNFFHAHAHSQFSTQDGMSPVADMVERAAQYGQPALAITDHGSLAGTVQLYTNAKKHGIKPAIGIETYVIDPRYDLSSLEDSKDAQRYHLGILALDLTGYKGLVGLSTKAFTKPRYHRFPRLLVDDLIEFGKSYGKHIAITTGCVFGFVELQLAQNGYDAARNAIRTLQAVTPNLYVEIQKHNIPDGLNEMPESEIVAAMTSLATELSLPMVATADCHYLDQKNARAHSMMKSIAYNSKEDDFPGDPYHLCSSGWLQEKFDADTWSKFEESYVDFYDKLNLHIPQLEKFQAHVPEVSKTPDTTLRKESFKNMVRLGFDEDEQYIERLNYELEVIAALGMANYFLLVLQCVNAMKKLGVPIEARGSANGSLILFLLGVTSVDPIIWKTNFDRFMAKDRVGAPDVDIDIADQYRWMVIEYLNSLEINGTRYKTSQIGTFAKMGQKIDDPNDAGSAFRAYKTSLLKQLEREFEKIEKELAEKEGRKPVKAHWEKDAKERFKEDGLDRLNTMADVKRLRPEDYEGLRQIISMDSVYNSRGKHPGGILISGEDVRIEEFVPQMTVGSDKSASTVTQFTMKDVEKLGLLKMDWLGQTSLTVMSKCMEYLGREDVTDFTWIPNNDAATLRFIASRKNHVGLFHLESFPKSEAMRQLAPKSTWDFVIHQAYSMPGAADSGAKDIYLDRRKDKNFTPEYTHPILKDTFESTLGVMIFQEQPLQVARDIGMTDVEVTNILAVMKDSGDGALARNKKRLAEAWPRFSELALAAGMTEKEIKWFWKQMIAMAGYGFSINHSAGYGIRCYRTAYLKKHHPLEYMAALLYCWAGSNVDIYINGKKIKKEQHYLNDAMRLGIKILPVVVGKSEEHWSIDKEKNGIRRGYTSIAGVGAAVAKKIMDAQRENPFQSLRDFCERANVSGSKDYLKSGDTTKGIFGKLYEMGAFKFDE